MTKDRYSVKVVNYVGFFKVQINGELENELYSSSVKALKVANAWHEIFANKTYRQLQTELLDRYENSNDIDVDMIRAMLKPYAYFYYDEFEDFESFSTHMFRFLDLNIMPYHIFCNIMDGGASYFEVIDWRK